MENASKALLIAAGILIGLIVITMIIYGVNQVSDYYSSKEASKQSEQLAAFNKQYIGYNRNDVRGSELLSLVNKIIDYNVPRMNDVNEEKIEITINIGLGNVEKFCFKNNSSGALIKSQYTEDGRTGGYGINANLVAPVSAIESYYTQAMATKLANNLTTLLGENRSQTRDQLLKELKIDYEVKDDEILRYYQYMQFKRAHFDCTDLTYKDGRVKSFTFVFNGTFE